MRLVSHGAGETFEIGKRLGGQAAPGEIYCLSGDLGTGKTIFTQGFAAGLGITEPVCSPTFTIVQEYKEGRLALYHFDVYRLEEPDQMAEIGYEDYFYGKGVCLIEWADRITELLPENCRHISLEKDKEKIAAFREGNSLRQTAGSCRIDGAQDMDDTQEAEIERILNLRYITMEGVAVYEDSWNG